MRLLLAGALGATVLLALWARAAHGQREMPLNKKEEDLQVRLGAFHATHPYRDLEVGRAKWHYMAGGHGERTLLLLPGGAMVPDQYFELISALEAEYRVIALAYPPISTMAELEDGVVAIMDAEGVARAMLFGSGPGGYLAQCFIRHNPDCVDRLILAHTGIRHHVAAGPVRALATVMSLLPEPVIRWGMWQLWRHELSAPPDTRVFWLGLMHDIMARQLSKAHLVALTRLFVDYNTHYHFEAADLAAWPGEILILESDHDEAFDADARAALRATYPRARVYTFHEAGLGAMFTHTEEYVGAVRDFLADARTVPRLSLRCESLLSRHAP